MKTVTVRDFQKKIGRCVDLAQTERVVVTRNGRPAAILIGVEGRDWEDIVLQSSPAFWRMIEARRREKPISLAEARRRLKERSDRRPKNR
jgi:prevent-host-death family protein